MTKGKRRLWAVLALLLVATSIVVTFHFGKTSIPETLYLPEYDEFVEIYTKENNLDKSFIYAVIRCESNFDKDAVSPVGAKGLMQIMPDTFTWLKTKTKEDLSEDMLFDPETSIKYGCYLYRILLDKFGCEETAAAAYHAGITIVGEWVKNKEYSSDGIHLDNIPYSDTETYVKRVMEAKEYYQNKYNF